MVQITEAVCSGSRLEAGLDVPVAGPEVQRFGTKLYIVSRISNLFLASSRVDLLSSKHTVSAARRCHSACGITISIVAEDGYARLGQT